MPEFSDDVKQQAAMAAMNAKDALNVDALPSQNATMQDVEQGPTTIPGLGFIPGQNYNPADPVPERVTQESPDAPDR
jgi:hypothetical protein